MKPLPTGGHDQLYFTTATIKDWRHLLRNDVYKNIITNSMSFLANEGAVWFYAFVIMPNHLHWIWQMRGETQLPNVQLRMLRFIAQQFKFEMKANHPQLLEPFKVERKDRQYQFFKDRPLSIPLFTDDVVWQKMEYIHNNPIQPKWSLAAEPEGYVYSSASFYANGDRRWPFITHFWYDGD
jgi:REP element-mobilizing transposase RayT